VGSPFQAALEARDLDGLRVLAPFLELGVFWTPDLSGDELAQPIEVFVPLYRRAKAAGLRLKAHVGEWGRPTMSGRQSSCWNSMRCKLGRVARIEDHPIRALFDAGVRVTVGTDDALMFGTSLSREFLALFDAGVMTAAELDAPPSDGAV